MNPKQPEGELGGSQEGEEVSPTPKELCFGWWIPGKDSGQK